MGFIGDITNLYLDNRISFCSYLESIGLLSGLKKGIRFCEDRETSMIIASICNRNNLTARRSCFGLKKVFSTNLSDTFYKIADITDPECSRFVLFIGDEDWAKKAEQVEYSGCDPLETAGLYSYPSCCGQNYNHIQQGEYWIDSFLTNAPTNLHFSWKCNKIAYLFSPFLTIFPDYFPCSPSCAITLNVADKYINVLKDYKMDDLLSKIRLHMQGLTLIAGGEIVYMQDFIINGNDYFIDPNREQHRLRYREERLCLLPDAINRLSLNGNSLTVYGMNGNRSDYETGPANNRILVFS